METKQLQEEKDEKSILISIEKYHQLEEKNQNLLLEYQKEKEKRRDTEEKYKILQKNYGHHMENLKVFLSTLNFIVGDNVDEFIESELQKRKQINKISYEFEVEPVEILARDSITLKESPQKGEIDTNKNQGIWDVTTLEKKEENDTTDKLNKSKRKTIAQITSVDGLLSAEQQEVKDLEEEFFKIDTELKKHSKTWTEIIEEEIKKNKNGETNISNNINIVNIQKDHEILAKKIGNNFLNHSVYLSKELLARIIMGIDLSIKSKMNVKDRQRKFKVVDNQTKKVFDFKDYSPDTFTVLRVLSGIQEDEYRKSFCENKMKVIITPGKSGAVLFFTGDRKFLLKTITDDELKFLQSILPNYFKFISEHPSTLICRILGMYTIKEGNRMFNFIAMENVFPILVDETYDLKGSHFGRDSTEEEKMKNFFKDNDLITRDTKLKMDRDTKLDFIHIITQDCNFLESMEIMDYSLLLGIAKNIENYDLKDNLKNRFTRIKSKSGNEMYYMGVIDILQKWNLKKKAEMSFKSFLLEKNQLSSIPPKDYAQRFIDFVTTKLIK